MRGELGISARKQGAAVRAFVGLPLRAPQQAPVVGLIDALRGRPDGDAVRWVNPEGLHLTLRFLGNVPTDRIPELADALRARLDSVEPFAIKLGGPEPFPAPRRPKVVVLGCSPADPVAELAARMEELAVELGFPPERRKFKAHLTLGRLRSRRMPALDIPAPEPAEWAVDRVVLFKSELAHDGARYEPLETFPLESANAVASDHSPLISNETERG
jgi:2'-5' RNA ligase